MFFLQGGLKELLERDSFYAPEVDIFRAVVEWSKANGVYCSSAAFFTSLFISCSILIKSALVRCRWFLYSQLTTMLLTIPPSDRTMSNDDNVPV